MSSCCPNVCGYLCRTQNTELCCPAARMCVDTFVGHRIQNYVVLPSECVWVPLLNTKYRMQNFVVPLSECVWVPLKDTEYRIMSSCCPNVCGYLCRTQNTESCRLAVRMCVGTFVEHRIQNYVVLLSECVWVPL